MDKSNPTLKNEKVFIVHGHNEELKLSVARTLEKLGLEPVILHEQPNGGKTIIEKLGNYSPPPVSRIFLKFWTILFEYVIVELASNNSEGIYYGLSKAHSGRYCETM